MIEGSAGTNAATRTAVFTVILSQPSRFPASIAFATANGTATAGADYESATGLVSFNPDRTTARIMISINGDTRSEVSETFFVNLSNPTNAIIGDGQAVCTILDDDRPTADLSVTKTASHSVVSVGTPLSYSITVTNNGPDMATGVSVRDQLARNVAFISATTSQGAVRLQGSTLRCDAGAIASGGSVTITLIVRPIVRGTVFNTAVVASQVFDPDPGNNSATTVTTVNRRSGDDTAMVQLETNRDRTRPRLTRLQVWRRQSTALLQQKGIPNRNQ